jgi:hypothetical protein
MVLSILAALFCLVEPPAELAARPTLFDPARHMALDEIRPGMRGYGLTVFQGTTIERFDVEVVSILRSQFGAKQDVVLIRCHNEFLDHAGAIQGMSGSPIFLKDETGHDRMIGAFAYGWGLSKDPLAGVQPIEYMLELAGWDRLDAPAAAAGVTWHAGALLSTAPQRRAMVASSIERLGVRRDAPVGLRRMIMPLAFSGHLDPASQTTIASAGFAPMASSASGVAEDVSIEPGSSLAVIVLDGDLQLTGFGTATEVIDGRVFGFGHEMFAEGSTAMPAAGGRVDLIVPSLDASFKIGTASPASATIDADGVHGIAGRLNAAPAMIPMTVHVIDEMGTERTFRYSAAQSRLLTPMLALLAVQSSITRDRQPPVEHMIDYDAKLTFDNGRELALANRRASVEGFSLGDELFMMLLATGENPFAPVKLQSMDVNIRMRRGVEAFTVLSARPEKSRIAPGESARLWVELEAFRGARRTVAVDVVVPADTPEGSLTIELGDAFSSLMKRAAAEPGLFTARTADEVLDVVERVAGVRSDRLYVAFDRPQRGVSVGMTNLRSMPASRRHIFESTGRTGISPTTSIDMIEVPLDGSLTGTAAVTIEVARRRR